MPNVNASSLRLERHEGGGRCGAGDGQRSGLGQVIRLFLDANVLFTAAHNPQGKAALVIALAADGAWDLVTSTLAAEEARRNLALKRMDPEGRLSELLAVMTVVDATMGVGCPLPLPEKDRPIFASARAARATHLLTGDIRDFGAYMNQPERTQGIVIQTVAQFLAGIVGRS